MATAPRKGFNRARNQGGTGMQSGLSEYTIASGYATALGTGDPVKLQTDGTIIQATNSAPTLGVFQGCRYIDASNRIQIQKYWPASQTSTETVTALVSDSALATWKVLAEGPIPIALAGDLYAMNLTAPDANTGRSQMTVKTLAQKTGSLNVAASTNIAALTGLANGDVFTVKSSVANVTTTVTIVTNMTTAQLLAAINVAGNGLTASVTAGNFLNVIASDGGNLVLADGTGTPLADSTILAVAGTYVGTVAVGSAMVQVCKAPTAQDIIDRVLEVVLVNNKYLEKISA